MKLQPNIVYSFYASFSTNPRPNVTAPSVGISGGSVRMYRSNTKDASGYDLKPDTANPFAVGAYRLEPLWGYIAFTPNADAWDSDSSYDIDETVAYLGSVYKSLKDANTSLPIVSSDWEFVETPVFDLTDGYYEIAK